VHAVPTGPVTKSILITPITVNKLLYISVLQQSLKCVRLNTAMPVVWRMSAGLTISS